MVRDVYMVPQATFVVHTSTTNGTIDNGENGQQRMTDTQVLSLLGATVTRVPTDAPSVLDCGTS